jgi:hypothetical protein
MPFAPSNLTSLHGRRFGLSRNDRLVVRKWDAVVPMLAANAVAASTAISDTTTETAFSNASYTIPANMLRAGSLIRFGWQGIATATNSTDTLLIKAYLGSTAIATGTATDVANNNIFAGEASIAIRTIGASGTFVANSSHTKVPAASLTASRVDEILGSTAIDTTVTNAITVKATWSVASASNSCRNDIFWLTIS